jgi:hypothetical protein
MPPQIRHFVSSPFRFFAAISHFTLPAFGFPDIFFEASMPRQPMAFPPIFDRFVSDYAAISPHSAIELDYDADISITRRLRFDIDIFSFNIFFRFHFLPCFRLMTLSFIYGFRFLH